MPDLVPRGVDSAYGQLTGRDRPTDQLADLPIRDHARRHLAECIRLSKLPARPGHSDPAITLRVYAHVIRAAEAAAADIFAQAVNAA
jgi:integrase